MSPAGRHGNVARVKLEWWPPFRIRVRTPRVELRPLTDEHLNDLCDLLEGGIHPPGEMPFNAPWTEQPRPVLQREALRFHWRTRADLTPDHWHLPFGVWVGARLVGQQDLLADGFPVRRTVSTGSWLGLAHQGQGIGREMRAAVLHFAFAGLGAERAETDAFADNAASLGVTRSLGYLPNGDEVKDRKGEATPGLRFALTRSVWEERRRDDITIEGLGPAREMFGA